MRPREAPPNTIYGRLSTTIWVVEPTLEECSSDRSSIESTRKEMEH